MYRGFSRCLDSTADPCCCELAGKHWLSIHMSVRSEAPRYGWRERVREGAPRRSVTRWLWCNLSGLQKFVSEEPRCPYRERAGAVKSTAQQWRPRMGRRTGTTTWRRRWSRAAAREAAKLAIQHVFSKISSSVVGFSPNPPFIQQKSGKEKPLLTLTSHDHVLFPSTQLIKSVTQHVLLDGSVSTQQPVQQCTLYLLCLGSSTQYLVPRESPSRCLSWQSCRDVCTYAFSILGYVELYYVAVRIP